MKKHASERVTLMSLAAASGVSHTTVSAAIRGKGNISQKMRMKILNLARKQGYTPHAAAQVLRSKKSGYLGLILSHAMAENGMLSLIVEHFLDTCEQEQQKYHIEYYRSRKEPQSPAPIQLSNSTVDGVIVAGFVDARLRAWLEKEKTAPWVSVEEPAAHAFISTIDQGFYEAVHYLYELGHRHFAYFGWDQPFTHCRSAVRGYQTACRRLGINAPEAQVLLTPSTISFDNYSSFIATQTREILTSGKNPTAILCLGFDIARVVQIITAEFGLHIPRDISIIASGPRSIAVQSYPRITFIEPDYSKMMKDAVNTLKQLVAGEFSKARTISIPTKLVHMESTGPAPVR